MSDKELNCQYFDVYKKNFKKYSGAIDEMKFDYDQAYRDLTKIEYSEPRKSEAIVSSDWIAMAIANVELIFSSIRKGSQTSIVRWDVFDYFSYKAIAFQFQIAKNEVSGDEYVDVQDSFVTLITDAEEEFKSSHWRAKAIKRRYDKLNLRNLPARIIAAMLYGLGTVYFVWIGALNVYKVLDQYGWVGRLFNMI